MSRIVAQYLPFLAVCLALKVARTALLVDAPGVLDHADALAPELGLHLVLLAAAGLGLAFAGGSRRAGVAVQIGLSVVALVLILLELVAVAFASETGGALDHHLFRFSLVNLVAVLPLIRAEVPASQITSIGILVTAFVGVRVWQILRRPVGSVTLRPAAIALALGVGLLLLFPLRLPAALAIPMPLELALGPLLHPIRAASGAELRLPPHVREAPLRPSGAPPAYDHLVVVALESTGLFATSLAEGGPDTTPFLGALAEESAVFERAYVAMPHSSKAFVALNCGITPLLLMEVRESEPDAMPVRCLPDLLREQGFQTLYFGSHVGGFEYWRRLSRNLGFAVTTTAERLDTEGYEVVNYFAYEDEVLLAPTREWLNRVAGRRSYSFYLTSTAHHDYQIPSRHPRRRFAENDRHDRYLNAVYYQDRFLEKLFGLYEEAGLADRTLFVVVGDHGEAFGEHGQRLHDHVIYDEVIRVPLVIRGRDVPAGRHGQIVRQTDLLDTVVPLLGFVRSAVRPEGRSMFERDASSVAHVSCFYTERCLAKVSARRKVISHFDHAPPEAYAIDVDPRETRNDFGNDPTDAATLLELHDWKEQELGRFLDLSDSSARTD